MKKQLLFLAMAIVCFALPSYGQSAGPNPSNVAQTAMACDLNLPGSVPSFNAQCTVEYADLTVPVITDSCGNTVVPTTDTGIFPITATGTTTIFWSYVNELGGIETQFQNINILDFILPVPDVAILPNFYSQCAVQAADLPVPSATDNCSAVTVTNNGVFPITVSTLITWTYTDATGNSRFQDQDIYINDFTEPVPDVAILPNVHALCQVAETDLVAPTATDNCGGAVTVTNDAVFPILRSTLITWFYSDANGNVSYQTQDIYIDDFTAPVADLANLPDVHALCQVDVADLAVPTATDNCSVASVTNDGIFPILASTTLTWTYADPSGNTITGTQNIIIDDVTAPVPDLPVLADVVSQCALSQADLVVPTATDNCSIASITSDAVFPITTSTTITWTYTDPNGNSVVQTQNIIIDDTLSPVPDLAVLPPILSHCALPAGSISSPSATDNCSAVIAISDAVYPITASTMITWTYFDADGNTATQTQMIFIDDTMPPMPDAAVLADINVGCQLLEIDVVAPTATDNCGGAVTVSNDGIFPITASTTITWTYSDADGNTTSQTQNVVVADTAGPTPDLALLANVTGQCEVLESEVALPTATDACSGVASVSSDAVFPITATSTINWTYTDGVGNTTTQTQQIIINDTTAPTPDAVTLADVAGQCEVLPTDLTAPSATDNCSGVVAVSNDGVFPITASTTITWTFADANGNTATQTQNIVINDTEGPTPDVAALTDITAQCVVLATDVVAPTATDNCSAVTVTGDGFFPITVSTVITWTYTDANGNTTTQNQNVLVVDTTSPTPDLGVLPDLVATCELLEIDVPVPTGTDNCSNVGLSSDAVFPITASTTITWTYFDSNGNITLQTQNVIITDAIAPTPDTFALVDIISECEVLEADVTVPTATDNCSIVTVTHDAVFPITASTTITWIYADESGNTAAQTQNVVINDVTKPVPDVAVLADVVSQCALLETDLVVPTATDNCSGVVTVTNDGVFPIAATTTITWTYTDANGNSDSQTQNISVSDTTAPTPDVAVLADITVQCELLEIDVVAPTATDNCLGAVTVSNDAIFPITASTIIIWRFDDANGNSTTQTQNVIVNDTTAPTPDVVVLADVTGTCEVLAIDMVAPTATDNCSGVVTVTNDGVFPIVASTTINWTYTDINGNTASQTQNIVITDTTAPTPDTAVLADVVASCEVLEIDVTVPTATDNCSAVTVTNNANFPITASTIITWTFTDANGNNTLQDQTIVISDTTAPVPDAVTLTDVTAQCQVWDTDLTVPTATDNCSISSVTNDGIFPITASTTITWTYTDANGNTATQTQNIVINDTTAPTPDLAVLPDVIAQCEVSNIIAPTAFDNCSDVTVTSDAVFPITAQGVTVVTWTFTDANGNNTTLTQDVLIGDNTAPVLTLADLSVSVNVAGTVTVTADQMGMVEDNCGIATVSVFPNTFDCTELGDHVVTVTAIDIHGNVTTQNATVTVTDPSDFCGALGVDQNEKGTFALYPNPTADELYIDGNGVTVRSVSVYALSGQLILNQAYEQPTERFSVSLSALPQGMYLVKLQTNDGTFTRRVMKK